MTLFLIQLTDIMQSIIRYAFSKAKRGRKAPIIVPPHQSVLPYESSIRWLPVHAQNLFALLQLLSEPRNIVAHPKALEAATGDQWNLALRAGNVLVTPMPLNALFVHLRGALQSPVYEKLFNSCGLESAQSLSVRGLDAIKFYGNLAEYQSIVTDDLLPESLELLEAMRRAPRP